ncbi:alpha 1,2 mannosyltransferase [Coemansia sp. RSA 552]|nr:alpha 1,2 mannosyltransferase [Coemansia sp. RSA 552]
MRYSRLGYAALLLLRLLLALSPVYIHPDEFFQAPEVAAGDILRLDALRTWEFTSAMPIRSIVPIYLYSGTPLLILRTAQHVLLRAGFNIDLVTSRGLFWASRLFMAILSFIIDLCVVRAIRRGRPGARLHSTRVLLATSHCLVVYHVHTFANSFASVLLAVCFDLMSMLEFWVSKPEALYALRWPSLGLGAVWALGTFTHVSFPMFALPLGFITVIMLLRQAPAGRSGRSIAAVLWIVVGGAITTAGIILADSAYYGIRTREGLSPVITVLNNIMYNSNHQNLASHGVHPWYTHLLVSMPVLFGPLFVLALVKLFVYSVSFVPSNTHYVSIAAACSGICGLAMLSAVPHQEARFLMPALPALAISTWRWHRVAPKYFWYAWIAFNALLSIGFGVVHQAGVVPMLNDLSRWAVLPSIQCHDIPGSDHAVCMDNSYDCECSAAGPRVQTNQPQASSSRLVVKQTMPGQYERTLFVMPASADIQQIVPPGTNDYRLVPLSSHTPHVNFDHIGKVLRNPITQARLNVYVACRPAHGPMA